MRSVYADRLRRVCAYMREDGFEQILVTSTPSVYYLTGLWIEPHERMMALYIDGRGGMIFFGNAIFAVEGENPSFECVLHGDGDNPVKSLAGVIQPGVIGVDKFWPAQFLLGLTELRRDIAPRLGSAPADKARMRKDSEEIERMRRASRLNDAAMRAAIGQLREGARETEIAAFLTDTYLKLGADFPVGAQGVSFGANAADPHHAPGKSALSAGLCALLDIFTPFDRYWCDMTRTVWFGSVSAEEERVYEAVRAANEAGVKAVRPGARLCDIDAAARAVITDAGYGAFFTHRLGHGCGLECHEPPDCSGAQGATAEAGMVFSIEPGIYIPGKYGVRIEDLVLVTETGCETLNAHTKDLEVV
jgi:Xaa-Pro dipeptidase